MKKNEIIDDYVVGDLTKKEDREKIIEKIINLKNKGYEISIFYNLGIIVPHSGNFADYKEDNIDLEYETNVKSIVKMDYELLKHGLVLNTIYMASISSFYRGGWDPLYQETKAALKAHIEVILDDDKRNNRKRKIYALFPDTIKTGEEGMGAKLENYPKIPGEMFVKEVVNIIEGKYNYIGYIFEISENNVVFMYGINPSKVTGAFEYNERELIKDLGKAVY
ncbi:MAG: hypothetical protein ACP5G1_01670, partial [Nanopusillaceae archaeon]